MKTVNRCPDRHAWTEEIDESFHEGLAKFFGGGWGFIDREGRVVIPAKFHEAANFSEGLAAVRAGENGGFGYVNQKGILVIPYRFKRAGDFHDGLAAVVFGKGAYGFIDQTGRVVLHSRDWLEIDEFSEGLAAVHVEVIDNSVYRGYQDRKAGFVDRSGKFVIQPQFYRVNKFSEGGLAAVAVQDPDEKKIWGYIGRPVGHQAAISKCQLFQRRTGGGQLRRVRRALPGLYRSSRQRAVAKTVA